MSAATWPLKPRYRILSAVPGNVWVKCSECERVIEGWTAADALDGFNTHYCSPTDETEGPTAPTHLKKDEQ